jgi:hypothetical protein
LEKKLTPTQVDLLAVLRARRREADVTEAAAIARAIGGLSETERFERGAMFCRAGLVAGAHVKTGTFDALVDAGLAERRGHLVRAISDTEGLKDETDEAVAV